ncbi:hypothetical protein [Paracoccus sp. SSK6]|uniref:hypothetical protein n=1 Tax=Paracoccus sp. SSK6 TaxID=3143131 RepID=UPI003219927C
MSLQNKGRKPRHWSGVLEGRRAYALTVAELLLKEHGGSQHTVKKLMRQTHASERTVKHWMSGQHGPDAVFFLRLMVSSPVIRAFFLGVIESASAEKLTAIIDRVALSEARQAYALGEHAGVVPATDNDLLDDPSHDTLDDPDSEGLNERQLWFLSQISRGSRCRASDLVQMWQISLKTARRDIASLKVSGMIKYVGSRRKGRYRRT